MVQVLDSIVFSIACNWLHQFWCDKSSTASLLQFCCWGFDVSSLLWVCWYHIFWIIGYWWSYIRLCSSIILFHIPRASLPLVTCSSPHNTSKEEDIMHPPGHFLLTLGDEFTTHGFILKVEIYHILACSSHGLNSQEIFLSLQLIPTSLHGSNFHHAIVYISDSV